VREQLNRAEGCLFGGAVGDAMGMPASFMTRRQIKSTYGYIKDFLPPDPGIQNVHTGLREGDITDDTYESLIVARVLVENKGFHEKEFYRLMKEWAIENSMLESDVIGPNTRKFLTALIANIDPKEGSRMGDTNGSAMRVAPVGIYYWKDPQACMKAAAASSMPSHGSSPAVAAAVAVAMACGAGIRGDSTPEQIMEEAIRGAEYGEKVGYDIPAPSVSMRIRYAKEAVDGMKGHPMSHIIDRLAGVLGAGMKAYESIPLALGIFYAAKGDPKIGIPAAVNAGDDADTNGAICGAICGAYSGIQAIPGQWTCRVNIGVENDLRALGQALLGG
jgi:ADP-ribosylglycohydrolase